MNWIKDVREELSALDTGHRALRSFSAVMILVPAVIVWIFYPPGGFTPWQQALIAGWALWMIAGLFKPRLLLFPHKIWMGLALALGWWVSRVLLTLIYYFILTPVALLARISGKRFLDRSWGKNHQTAWVKRQKTSIDFTKMS